jgi:hypothetical protein
MGLVAVIVAIVGIILALPSVFALLYSPYTTAAILGIILGVVIIVFAIVFKWYIGCPPWTVLEYHNLLKIKTRNGNSATLTKTIKIKANHQGLTEFIHRNIRSDGQIGGFYLGSTPVPISDITIEAQEYIVREKLTEVRRGEIKTSQIKFDLKSSFKESHEFTGYAPDYYTKKAKIEIHFPRNRPARNAKAYCGIGAERRELNLPVVSGNGNIVTWEREKLKPGQRYRVEWDW